MSKVGQREILTQRHIIRLFKDDLGYEHLGYWKDRPDNANIEEGLLTRWLRRRRRHRESHLSAPRTREF